MSWFYAALLFLAPDGDAARPSAAPDNPPVAAQLGEAPVRGDGRDAANAIKVESVDEEYAILRKLGLRPTMQSLMMVEGRPYDMLNTIDPRTGKTRELWFDIGSFYGKGVAF